MKKSISLLFLSVMFCSCSTLPPSSRNPAAASALSCRALMLEVTQSLRNYSAADFAGLDLEWVDQLPMLGHLVSMHQRAENQEKARIILSLIRKNSPELSERELAEQYTRLFNRCPRNS